MKTSLCLGSAILVLALLSACGVRDKSPPIVCELDGKIVTTAFTFESFRKTLSAEHGKVEVQPDAGLKTRSIEVTFRKLEDGRLLAEKVVLINAHREMAPAVLFGLTNAVVRVPGGRPAPGAEATNRAAGNPPAN